MYRFIQLGRDRGHLKIKIFSIRQCSFQINPMQITGNRTFTVSPLLELTQWWRRQPNIHNPPHTLFSGCLTIVSFVDLANFCHIFEYFGGHAHLYLFYCLITQVNIELQWPVVDQVNTIRSLDLKCIPMVNCQC